MMPVPVVAASFSASVKHPESNGAAVKSCLDGGTVKSCLSSTSSCLARSASLHSQHVERVAVIAGSKSRDHLNTSDTSSQLTAGSRGSHNILFCFVLIISESRKKVV